MFAKAVIIEHKLAKAMNNVYDLIGSLGRDIYTEAPDCRCT